MSYPFSPTPPDHPTPWGLMSLKGYVHHLSLRKDQAVLCCINVMVLIAAGVCYLVGGSVSVRSPVSKIFVTVGGMMRAPSTTTSSSISLIQPHSSPASVHWVTISICNRLFLLLVGPLEGHPCQDPIFKHLIASVTVSGHGTSTRAGI